MMLNKYKLVFILSILYAICLSSMVNGDKVKTVSITTWNLTNENQSELPSHRQDHFINAHKEKILLLL